MEDFIADGQNLIKYTGKEKEVTLSRPLAFVGKKAFYKQQFERVIFQDIKEIGDFAFAEDEKLNYVKLNNGIQKIGNYAFFYCGNLKSIELPKSILELGVNAFASSGITKIKLPTKLKEIKNETFSECENLEQINFGKNIKSIGERAFLNCKKLEELPLLKNVSYIGASAFEGSGLKNIKLPNLENICERTFKGTMLTSVTIPNSVSKIKTGAFSGCELLEVAVLPDKIQDIAPSIFEGCKNLKEITIPDYVKEIGNRAFAQCEKLGTISIPARVEKIGNSAFINCRGLEEVKLPERLKSIGENAFNDCTKLKKINLPEGVTKLSNGVFSNSGLTHIVLPNKLTLISDEAFNNCRELQKVEFPETLESIGSEAFTCCGGLKSVKLPDNLSFVGGGVFAECKNLENVQLSKGLTVLSDRMLIGCNNLKEIAIPKSVKSIDDFALSGTGITDIEIDEKVTYLGRGVFSKCANLVRVKMPNGLKILNEALFSGCKKLKYVELPDSITDIRPMAFSGNRELEKIVLPKNLKTIEDQAFRTCEKLKEVVLPDGLEKIGKEAFSECCSLEKIVIPSSVQMIDEKAFTKCDSLKSITINGGVIGDNALNIGENIEEIVISKNCKYISKGYPPIKYLTRKGDYFYLTKEKLSEDSISLDEFASLEIPVGIVMDLYDYSDKLLKEIKGSNGKYINLMYQTLYPYLEQEKFEDFFNNKELKFFNELCKNYELNDNFIKFYYNLGGFSKPIKETNVTKSGKIEEKIVDYAQKLTELLKLYAKNDSYFMFNFTTGIAPMEIDGIKEEFTKFFCQKDNFIALMKQEILNSGFIAKCYNNFEEIQLTNTSDKGRQRQLKPTVEKFIVYFNDKKFKGVKEETKHIAKAIAPFFSNQKEFDNAVKIDNERKNNGAPNNILNERLQEKDLFKNIDKYSASIKSLFNQTLNNMARVANKNFTFDWLEKNDPTNYLLGKFTSSCAHLHGHGYGIMRASIILPDVQNMVIRDKTGIIIAKATLYVNCNEGYGVVNAIEVSDREDEENYDLICNKIVLGLSAFAERYNKKNPDKPLKVINIGDHANSFENTLNRNLKKSSKILQSLNYQDYGHDDFIYNGDTISGQFIAWEEKNN